VFDKARIARVVVDLRRVRCRREALAAVIAPRGVA
jgi:hypothetical protein